MNGKVCDLQYSSVAMDVDVDGRVCGALVQFGYSVST